ncbi:hypothetical protein ACHAW6_000069 [Cyclotella cf. meneghiniana]
MALSHDPEMGHGYQAVGSQCHQIPTLHLHRACLLPEHQVAIHLPDSPRCRSEPRASGECPSHKVPARSSLHRWTHRRQLRTLLRNGVKTGGLVIRDPTLAAASLYSTSVEATDMLTGTLIRNKPINVEAHQNCVRSAGTKHWKTRRDGEVAFHTALMERSPPKVKKRMEHATTAGAWLSTILDRFSGTELTKDE